MAQRLQPVQKIILSTILLAFSCFNCVAFAADVYGIADASGKIVKQPTYKALSYLRPNCFVTSDEDIAPEQFNANGKDFSVVHKKKFPKIADDGVPKQWLGDNLVLFESNKQLGVSDSNGNVVIEPKYSGAGYAGEEVVCLTEPNDFAFPVKFYNSQGKYLYKTTQGMYRGQQFSEGLLNLGDQGKPVLYIDTAGKEKIIGALTSGEPFQHGLAAVTIATREMTGAGFIDRDGTMKIGAFKHARVQTFDDGFGVVNFYAYDVGGQPIASCGVTDSASKIVVPPEYEDIYRFSKKFFVAKKDSRFLLIDSAGNVVLKFPANCSRVVATNSDEPEQLIPCAFLQPKEDLAVYEKKVGSLKYGFCDMHGNIKIAPKYRAVETFERGLAPVYEEGQEDRAGLIKIDGSVELALTYRSVQRCPDGNYIISQSDGTDKHDDDSAYSDRPEIAFPRALREHNLIGMSKDKLVNLLGSGEVATYKRSGIPENVKETTQYQLYGAGTICGNAAHWLEFGFDSSGKVYGWRNIGFQHEGKWCRENVVFPQNSVRFSLDEAVPKALHYKS